MLDIFDILGPVMIGPSSSHTAGAARIGAMARTLLGAPPVKAAIHLYGSFAETGSGHGTDRALVGGLLGMKPDDPRLPNAFEEAKKAGLTYTIDEIKLRDAHPNTAVIDAESADGKTLTMQASSIGGGRIMVNKLDGIDVNFNGMFNTLVIRNEDASGTVAAVTSIFAMRGWQGNAAILCPRDVIFPLSSRAPSSVNSLTACAICPGCGGVIHGRSEASAPPHAAISSIMAVRSASSISGLRAGAIRCSVAREKSR